MVDVHLFAGLCFFTILNIFVVTILSNQMKENIAFSMELGKEITIVLMTFDNSPFNYSFNIIKGQFNNFFCTLYTAHFSIFSQCIQS